jgi:antitoxin (DNA-binding transcriptional repressor) of toxin-antitoxin stability system
MARKYGRDSNGTVSIFEPESHLPHLYGAVKQGETAVITRHGEAVARLASMPDSGCKVVLGGMAERVKVLHGCDDKIDIDDFLGGDI